MICWPFFPNWKTNYTDTYAYLTEILVSDSGKEQRRAYRVCARRIVRYDGLFQRDRLRALRRQLAVPGLVIAFPDEVQRTTLAGGLAQGANIVAVTGSPAWLTTGRLVIVEDRVTREREVHTVDSFVGGFLSLAEQAQRPWAAGTWVMPAFEGTLDGPTKLNGATTEVGTTSFQLVVEPGTEVEIIGAAPVVFAGKEVLAHGANWSNELEFETTDPTAFVDYEQGVRFAYRFVNFNTEVRRASHMVRSPADLNATLGCFMRAKGRQGEFYLPSGLNDITLSASIGSGQHAWTVAGFDFFEAYAADTIRRAFAVRLLDGRTFYFRILSMAKSTSGAARTIIQTIENTSVAIDLSAIDRISWMPVSRFAADEISVSWVTDQVANISIATQSLEALP